MIRGTVARHRHPTRRLLWAALLAALCLSSAFEIHPTGEMLAPDLTGATLAVPATGHPVTSTHIEASFVREVPPCPACLLRLQTRGVRHVAVARVAVPTLAERLAAGAPRPHEGRDRSTSSARAPPLA